MAKYNFEEELEKYEIKNESKYAVATVWSLLGVGLYSILFLNLIMKIIGITTVILCAIAITAIKKSKKKEKEEKDGKQFR